MKIGFILSSQVAHPIASTRVAIMNMLPYLQLAGHETQVLFEPASATSSPVLDLDADRIADEGYDVVCFQKVTSPSAIALAEALKARGIKTISVVCDLVFADMTRATDATFVVTDYLRSLYPAELHSKIHIVHDGIENPDAVKTSWRTDPGSRGKPLNAVLVTSSRLDRLPVFRSPPSWLKVSIVAQYPTYASTTGRLRDIQWHMRQQFGWRAKARYARFLASPRIARVPWHPVDVYDRMLAADIGILPFDRPYEVIPEIGAERWKVKSENRLTMKMNVGLPVIATPIPAYEAIVKQGVNGFLATSPDEWMRAFDVLRDPALRRRIGSDAHDDVSERFSKRAQADKWLAVLDELTKSDRRATRESVAVQR